MDRQDLRGGGLFIGPNDRQNSLHVHRGRRCVAQITIDVLASIVSQYSKAWDKRLAPKISCVSPLDQLP